MAEKVIVNKQDLVDIADAVRNVAGSTGKLALSELKSKTITVVNTGGEDVSAETAEYTSQLNTLETVIDSLPDAGSGGGSSDLETCTVVIVNNTGGDIGEVWYTTYNDGTISTDASYIFEDDGSKTFTNVLKKTVFSIGRIAAGYSSYTATPSNIGIVYADDNRQSLIVNLYDAADTNTITIN